MQNIFNRIDVSHTNIDVEKQHQNGEILPNPSGKEQIFQPTALYPLDRTKLRRRECGMLDEEFIFAGFAR